MKKYIYGILIFFLSVFILEQRGVFLVEPVEAKECKIPDKFSSPETKVNLIELYTSEGCSSCPPAEKWVNSLYNNKDLYKTFIPVAFHVDYWDYIGHKDPMASPKYTQRQRNYSNEWGSRTIYTPGFVLNGEEWRSLRRKIPDPSSEKVGVLSVKKEKDKFTVSFKGSDKSGPSKKYDYYYATLSHNLMNKIRRGENRGRTLKHYFVVDKLRKKDGSDKGATFSNKTLKEDQSVVFWVTKRGSQKPLQAAGTCL